MVKLEVLCTTMHQTDFSKFKDLNIQSDVVFANQANSYSYEEIKINGYTARMITTPDRGVGKNRNIALLYAKGDICLFADDDICYTDGYAEKVLEAFKDVPDADVIIFNIDSKSDRKQRKNLNIERGKIWSVLGYGAPRIAVKLSEVHRNNLTFSFMFGGGAPYASGEDSMWLLDALRHGLKIYIHSLTIGEMRYGTSTWFRGYDEEYFFNRGAWVQAAFPNFLKYILIIYYILRFRGINTIKNFEMVKCLLAGMKAYKKNKTFIEWKEQGKC